ncbi:MAG: hypothetical protein ACREUZ_22305, partial [Burkholderiales bacterium]
MSGQIARLDPLSRAQRFLELQHGVHIIGPPGKPSHGSGIPSVGIEQLRGERKPFDVATLLGCDEEIALELQQSIRNDGLQLLADRRIGDGQP